MRIRSIKPEFWASEDIAALPWDTRLLFIGLWSYVDDNGVGRDNEKLIKADLFPLEDDPRDTLATVSRGLAQLAAGGQITRYTVDDKPYLHIDAWKDHQRIDRPAKARYPLPTSDDAVSRDTLATVSRQSRDTPAAGAVDQGTGEQGNRGTGEQGLGGTDDNLTTFRTRTSAIEPPTTCSAHRDDPNPPACGGCARAREHHEQWTKRRDAAAKSEQAHQRAADRRAEIDRCRECDDDGRLTGGKPCLHDPRLIETAKRGIAAVKEALA